MFLRILEYYNGILFLTTNRVGTLDEAFKSRIHVILYYPPLSKNQTEGIWRINIRKLKQIEEERHIILDSGNDSDGLLELPLKVDEEEILEFALTHWQQHQYGKGRWNGRQIRNAFQIAAALARFEMRTIAKKREMEKIPNAPSEPLQGELKARHFKAVAETSHHFEMYMNETMGKTDAEIALEHGNRADHVSRLKQKVNEKPVIQEHLDFDYYEGHSGGEKNYREGHSLPRHSNTPGWGSQGYSTVRQSVDTTRSLGIRPEITRSSSSEAILPFKPHDRSGSLHIPEDNVKATKSRHHPEALRAGWPSDSDPKIRPRRKTQPAISGAWSGVESDYE